jgi:hypothetical protein
LKISACDVIKRFLLRLFYLSDRFHLDLEGEIKRKDSQERGGERKGVKGEREGNREERQR